MIKPYHETSLGKLYCGDCLEILQDIPENSIDSIITDPPYELGFMGKKWDSSGVAYSVDMWTECLRVLKPGGHLLSFGGTRTYHRMASAIEDAGFQIRDMINWCYGSGFPKSLSVGKAVDNLQGNEREEIGIYAEHSLDGAKRTKNPNIRQVNYGASDVWDRQLTKGTSEWEGWGTALKPAHEPICMARKNLEKGLTVAENVLKWGTGGLNIDVSRVSPTGDVSGWSKTGSKESENTSMSGKNYERESKPDNPQGRFPANLIHDNSEEVRECFPETGKSKSANRGLQHSGRHGGNASRFFKSIAYYPKASKAERNRGCEGLEEKVGGGMAGTADQTLLTGSGNIRNNKMKNNHPTVKPIALMEYLINMVTREGQIVLDPFMGSGTTGVACERLNRKWIMIEKELKYVEISAKRIEAEASQLKLWR